MKSHYSIHSRPHYKKNFNMIRSFIYSTGTLVKKFNCCQAKKNNKENQNRFASYLLIRYCYCQTLQTKLTTHHNRSKTAYLEIIIDNASKRRLLM
ncbi:hypothetical protein RFI_00580 [Reticulomyxa filosa]|uniref:Uncharacterized protein n=1 Tax=Reticulomyxa filosa TaxID=46433 RepID=X6PFM7_RETFI|nr:hypothetical protein RFI_00580 [Reticulomyxa filosa]|eukprot:ETO36482.1 hypothetical protein RFI_00580 [Reticulomyxa filosa]